MKVEFSQTSLCKDITVNVDNVIRAKIVSTEGETLWLGFDDSAISRSPVILYFWDSMSKHVKKQFPNLHCAMAWVKANVQIIHAGKPSSMSIIHAVEVGVQAPTGDGEEAQVGTCTK